MRVAVVLLLILGCTIQKAYAFGVFKDALQRVKEEAGHISTSLRDKERMQAKLKDIQRDAQELYQMTLAEAQRAAGPYLQAGQQSWAQFRVRARQASSHTEKWLREQHQRATSLHLKAVSVVHHQLTSVVSKVGGAGGASVMIERNNVAIGLLAAYSGAAALALALLLRRAN